MKRNVFAFFLVIINVWIIIMTQTENSEKKCSGNSKITCLEENNELNNNEDGQCCWFNGTTKNENTEFVMCMLISETSDNTLVELIQTYKNFSFDCPEKKISNIEELCKSQYTKKNCLWENNKIENEFGGKCCWINAKEKNGLQTASCMFINSQDFNESIASLNKKLNDVQVTCDINFEEVEQEDEITEIPSSSQYCSIMSLILIALIF